MNTARNGGRSKRPAYGLPLLLMCMVLPGAALAHQLDEYLQGTIVDIEPGRITLQINLTPGVAIAGKVLEAIDCDRDGVISTNEAAAYTETLKRELAVKLDGREIALRTESITMPEVSELRTGSGIILVDFSGRQGALAPGAHVLTFQNRHFPAISAYLLNAARPQSGLVKITGQKRDVKQNSGEVDFEITGGPQVAGVGGGMLILAGAALLAVGAGACFKNLRLKPAV